MQLSAQSLSAKKQRPSPTKLFGCCICGSAWLPCVDDLTQHMACKSKLSAHCPAVVSGQQTSNLPHTDFKLQLNTVTYMSLMALINRCMLFSLSACS